MKSTMPFMGVNAQNVRQVAKRTFLEWTWETQSEWLEAIIRVWRHATYREERYAAIQLAEFKPYGHWLDPNALPVIEEMIVSGSWWDFVDVLATRHMGTLLQNHRNSIRPVILRWAVADDVWKRRTALLAQLKSKPSTDVGLLLYAVDASKKEDDFFLRKGIGWAVREYSKTDPQMVLDYVSANSTELSTLSKREALKILLNSGKLDQIP